MSESCNLNIDLTFVISRRVQLGVAGSCGTGQGAHGAVRTRPENGGLCRSYGGCCASGVPARRGAGGRGADPVECKMAGERRARAVLRGPPRGSCRAAVATP